MKTNTRRRLGKALKKAIGETQRKLAESKPHSEAYDAATARLAELRAILRGLQMGIVKASDEVRRGDGVRRERWQA